MPADQINGPGREFAAGLREILALRQFPGTPAEFWPRFLSAAARLISGDMLVLLMKQPDPPVRWVKLGEWTSNPQPSRARTGFTSQLEPIGERALTESGFVERSDISS